MLQIDKREHPLSMQIFGSDPLTMAKAACQIELAGADIVDINMLLTNSASIRDVLLFPLTRPEQK